MDLSSAKLSSTLPSSCREKQVRWHVSSLSISTWWISWTISWGETWWRGGDMKPFRHSKKKKLRREATAQRWSTLGPGISAVWTINDSCMEDMPYLEVKGLCARGLDFDSEACVLDHNHFLFVGVVPTVRVPILFGLHLHCVLVCPAAIHHCRVCAVLWLEEKKKGDDLWSNHFWLHPPPLLDCCGDQGRWLSFKQIWHIETFSKYKYLVTSC